MSRFQTPAMALSLGRFTGAVLQQLRSPGSSAEDFYQLGSSTAQLAATIVRSRAGAIGPSWLAVIVLVGAQGALAEMPVDSGAQLFGELADGAVFLGATVFTMLVAFAAFVKWLPRLRFGLPQPQPAPFLTPHEAHVPRWRLRTLRRGQAAR